MIRLVDKRVTLMAERGLQYATYALQPQAPMCKITRV